MYTVVVADDEEEIRKAIIQRVKWEEIGFQVVGEAENGAEAIELVERLEPDLLLTDIKMPFVSGIELARQVREIRPTTQIAYLSGFDDFTYAQHAIQYNIISYMLKPISTAELTDELKKIKEKIDEKFEQFVNGIKEKNDNKSMSMLLPLIFDEHQKEDDKQRDHLLLNKLVECEIIPKASSEYRFSIMATYLFDETDTNVTEETYVNSINPILEKYFRRVTFFVNEKMITLLIGTKGTFEKYIYIATEEIVQSVSRIMGKKCIIGVGKVEEGLSNIHRAYMDAMKAIKSLKEMKSGVYFISDIERYKNSTTLIVEQALDIIENDYMNPDISLGSVSAQIAVSPNYLSALIKKETGNTFIELLVEKRIKVAKELLRGTNKKIREIAEECGYNDQHYFSYCFKKYTGISPNKCRNSEG
ncbi:MAG: response regulator [Lachnospiraceae bacterium]|nr:response regulator [Lachnospiraceae bacterium]